MSSTATEDKYIILDRGISGVLLVPQNDQNKVIKCYNQCVEMSDGTLRDLTLEEKNYCFAKYYNKEELLELLTQLLSPPTIDFFDKTINDFKDELNILRKLKNKPNIVQLVGDGEYQSGAMVGFIMERLPMNLYEWIYSEQFKRNNDYLLIHLTRQLLYGLYQIHSIDLAHLDIKPHNLLYDPTLSLIKYADFGNSSFKIPKNHRDCSVGYRAPELYHKTKFESMDEVLLLDVWSLGCVIYEVVLGHRCFEKQLVLKYDNKIIANVIANVMISGLEGQKILLHIVTQMITWKPHRKNSTQLIELFDKHF
jgi:serine/threonine protein kinase